MEILRAIEIADKLCPNHYTIEEKISWCDEVSAEIRRNIIKKYNVLETTLEDEAVFCLPPKISFERIEKVIVGKKKYDKLDFRSSDTFSANPNQPVKIIYVDLPDPIRITEIKGKFNTTENSIRIDNPPFEQGDKIQITHLSDLSEEPDYNNSTCAYIIEITERDIILDRDILEAETSSILSIKRVITDVTEIDEAPYDRMYIEYILSKIALYQHDYSSYNAHMMQYNSLFESARREFFTRNPLTTQVNFKNYSLI